jgi:hypothetical protein
MRIYDPRVGRFLSVDPIAKNFAWNSPYAFSENSPANFIDLDGTEKAGPETIDMAKQLLGEFGDFIIRDKNLMKITTDKTILAVLRKSIEADKKAYAAIAVFIYENRMSPNEIFLYYLNKSIPVMNEGLDLTPAGDVKVVITGKNFEDESKSRLAAAGFLALDVFGGEIAGALGKGINIVKNLSGPGAEALEAIIQKTGRISEALDETHIRAAVNDVLGDPVVINGKTYDHYKEVQNALKGLGNQIQKLNKLIDSGKAPEEVLDAAKDLRGKLQIQKDGITDVLNRAIKKAGS